MDGTKGARGGHAKGAKGTLSDFYSFLEVLRQSFETRPVSAWLFVILLGIAAGSFLSALYSRLAEGKKVFVFAPAECRYCKTILKWRDIVPIFSLVWLKGKCRYCESPLPRELLILEIGSVLVLGLQYLVYGPSLLCWAYSYFLLSLFLISIIDLNEGLIPTEITLKGIALGMLLSFLFPELMQSASQVEALIQSALGFLTGVLLLGAIRFIGDLILREEIVGLGDVMLMGMVGSFLRLILVLLTFFLAPLLVLPLALNFWIGKNRASKMPYGPFIALAAVLSLYWGDIIFARFHELLVPAV